jgi:hypothetical protein
MSAAEANEALTFLESLQPLTAEEEKLIRADFDRDFPDAYAHWFRSVNLDCAESRVTPVRGLMNRARAVPNAAAELKNRVTSLMKRPRVPILLNVLIDIVLLDYGLSTGFWAKNPALLDQVRKRREELKAYSREFSTKHDAILKATNFGDSSRPDDIAAELRATKNLPLFKTAILEEFDRSHAELIKNRNIVELLR